jgi:hypothetical protein
LLELKMNSVILSEIAGTGKCAAENNPTTNSDNIPRGDSTFLVLAPVKSTTYPLQPASPTTSSPSDSPVTACLTSTIVEPITKERRSSSTSSTGPFSKRYLKLSPVYGGGDSGVPDYVDIEEE